MPSRSLRPFTRVGKLLVVAALGFVTIGAVRAAAPAQLIPGVPQRLRALPQAFQSRLRASKRPVNLQELQRSYFLRDNRPYLRVKNLEVPLLPVEALTVQPTAAQVRASQALEGPVSKYRDFIFNHGRVTIPPQFVDRRPQQTPVKSQLPRPTCYAFASIAGLEAAYANTSLDLSENMTNYWFMRKEGKGCKDGWCSTYEWGTILKEHPVAEESYCPYERGPSFSSDCTNGADPLPAKCTTARSHATYGIGSFTSLWRDASVSDTGAYVNNPDYLKAVLASGKEIVVGMDVAGWTDSTMAGVIDVQLGPDGNPLPSVGGHVVLVVGFNNPNQYFIVKNSWGTSSGHAGYVYLTYDYMRTYAGAGYIINSVRSKYPRLQTPRRELQRPPLTTKPRKVTPPEPGPETRPVRPQQRPTG